MPHFPASLRPSLALLIGTVCVGLLAGPSVAQHAPSGPSPSASAPTADAPRVPDEAKAAFRAFATAESPDALTATVTRSTAFELGAFLLFDYAVLSRSLEKDYGNLLDPSTQDEIGTSIRSVMKKYTPEENPGSREARVRKMRSNGHSFFLDMVRLSNETAERLGAQPHVDMSTFLGNIPAERHWTFEAVNDTTVNVLLPGDRVTLGTHSFLMSGPPHVVKTDGEWKVQITGVSRLSIAPSSGRRLHLEEPLSIDKDQLDTFFDTATSLPLTPPMSETPPHPTARSGPTTVTLQGLDVEHEQNRLVPTVDLRVFLPPFPHLGVPRTSFRTYSGEIAIDQVTDTEGNTYSDSFWDEEVVYTLDSRFATPHGMGPAMEAEYSQALNAEGLSPAALSSIKGSVTLFFPIDADTSSVPVGQLTSRTALSAGDVTVRLKKQDDQTFTVVWSRSDTERILRLYGRTADDRVVPLDLKSSDHEDGTHTGTAKTGEAVKSIALCAGRRLYEKTIPFSLDLTVQRASIPLFEPGAATTLGGTTFTVVNSTYSQEASEARIFLRQDGPLSTGTLADIYHASGTDPDTPSRGMTVQSASVSVGYTRFLRFDKKPDELLLFLTE